MKRALSRDIRRDVGEENLGLGKSNNFQGILGYGQFFHRISGSNTIPGGPHREKNDMLYLFQVENTTQEKVVQNQGNAFAAGALSPFVKVDVIGIKDFPIQSAIPIIDDKEIVPVDSTEMVTPKALAELPNDIPNMCTIAIEKNVSAIESKPELSINPYQPSETEGMTLENTFEGGFAAADSAKVRTVFTNLEKFCSFI